MRRSSSLRRRVKEIEQARGAGAVTVTHKDGSKEGFHFSRNDRLKVLLASFDLARASRDLSAVPSQSPRAIQVAKAIGVAKQVTPPSALWGSIAEIVRNAENCTNTAPDPASAHASERKE